MKYLILSLAISPLFIYSNQDSTSNPLTISGYIETYYAIDASNNDQHVRPNYVYSFNRTNELNLNIGLLKLSYNTDFLRGNLAIATGTYINANYESELGVLKNLFEGNVGVKLSNKENLWIDAGVFASHIGFESAISKDCWTLTRSILAENSPYYETGVKMTYTSKDEKWLLSALILNGWQKIQRKNGNNLPALGHQLQYKPNNKWTLNSSSFLGNSPNDSINKLRFFHNFYSIVEVNHKLSITAGIDIGAQQKFQNSTIYSIWYSWVIMGKYALSNKLNMAGRWEYYHDSDQVMIETVSHQAFKTFSYSLNLDYSIRKNVLWRIEAKGYHSSNALFVYQSGLKNGNYLFTTSLSLSF